MAKLIKLFGRKYIFLCTYGQIELRLFLNIKNNPNSVYAVRANSTLARVFTRASGLGLTAKG